MSRLIDADELKTAFPCGEHVRTESVRATIDHAPTVTQWIPCSERQPTEDGEYITTVEVGEGMFVTTTDWRQDWKEWGFLSYYGAHDEPAWRRVTNVVAWMPLPEPHKNKEGQG